MVNIAILQARFNSSRLPGKGLFSFFNQTIWERMCDIACDIKICDKVIFAYGGTCYHKELKEHLREKNIEIFTGMRMMFTKDLWMWQRNISQRY